MNLAFPRLSKLTASETLAPDFAVLLAGLSAHQSASATARHQILLDRSSEKADAVSLRIRLFTQAASATLPAGSFSDSVAKTLTINSGR